MPRRFFLSITLILLLLVFVISACSDGPVSPPVTETQPLSTPTSALSSATPTSEPHFRVGEQVAVGTTWVVTLSNVTPSSGDSSYTPPAGKQLLIFAISQQNRSSQAASVNGAADWSLRQSTGASFQAIKTDYGEMPIDNVEPGASSNGELVYEVPVSVHHFLLTFTPTSGEDLRIWDIST